MFLSLSRHALLVLPASTDHIVGHHAAHHDHRAHQRSGTDHFMVKDGYQDGVEDRLAVTGGVVFRPMVSRI